MGREAGAEEYDALYQDSAEYAKPVTASLYYPLFRAVVAEVSRQGMRAPLEVGCGSGALATLLADQAPGYRGFDFSAVAVQAARRRPGDPDRFHTGDALDPANYQAAHDGIICTEVLEHVARDLDVVGHWSRGLPCVCSVPNFPYDTHVRHFRHEDDVRARYGSLLRIERIARVTAPLIRGRGMRNWGRQLRWARHQPRRALGLLGVNSFDWHAGWFVFSGKRA